MLTRPEFLKGWLFLTAQPWGKAYRSGATMPSGEPDPASLQSEFYYRAVTQTVPSVWYAACQSAAQGEHWPSVDSLRQSIRNLTPVPVAPALTHQDHSYITKEQFGLTLYEILATISGIRGLEEQIAGAIHREQGYKLQDLKARRLTLKATLAAQLPTLPESDMADVLARYPYVVSL